jgi:DNA-binding transcriptional regulator YiaG
MRQSKNPFDPDYVSQLDLGSEPVRVDTKSGTRVTFPEDNAWRKLDEHPVATRAADPAPRQGRGIKRKSPKKVESETPLNEHFVTDVGEFRSVALMEVLQVTRERLQEAQHTYDATHKTPFMWSAVLWLYKEEPELVGAAAKLLNAKAYPPTVDMLRERSRLSVHELALLLGVNEASVNNWRREEGRSASAVGRHRRSILLILKMIEISPKTTISHLAEYQKNRQKLLSDQERLERLQARFRYQP